MITLLIGHRGTGKSTFLSSLRDYARNFNLDVDCLDLDAEMERASGKTASEIFAEGGEKVFRAFELETLRRIVKEGNRPAIVAVGAGFEGPIPEGTHVVWLRRATDSDGRVFHNRPRLNDSVSAWDEYQERFAARERRYEDWAHEQLMVPEGYVTGLEEFFFEPSPWNIPYELTLSPRMIADWRIFWRKRLFWKLRRVEVRDDLLSPEEIKLVLNSLEPEQILFSRRRPESEAPPGVHVDWALELGPPPKKIFSLSIHTREGALSADLKRLSDAAPKTAIQKAAVEIESFAELIEGHRWYLKSPKKRAFLPRSKNGRWRWYRSIFGRSMPLHFFREGEGSAADQPYLWQEVLQPNSHGQFAAVLGSPVDHSRSPMEHREYFRAKNIPFVAIDVPEEEFEEALPILIELGLGFASVTSPLKKKAYAAADLRECSGRATDTGAANTLFIHDRHIGAENTDVMALSVLKEMLDPNIDSVWLWGGGGIKTSVQEVWPEVRSFSARMGTDRTDSPDLLIWATGRSREFQWPPETVRPRLVLDLNYGDDSPGLEWATREGLPYRSGMEMFNLQAGFQREFWTSRLNV